MPDLNPLFEFSRTHCVAICTFLVPANLLVTIHTLWLVGFARPIQQIHRSIAIAILLALVMISHVMTWFIIGVVMTQTYVLLSLGTVCLVTNLWAIAHPTSLHQQLINLINKFSLLKWKVVGDKS
ncbi:MAG: hypothetical protein KME16_09595 [Scytolyngbya sp. HA4215-MV1]|jgi:hypothetical protein|nr:hypothetical protein [Scytolyngbya sp. HA4215-MV1]